MSCLHAKVGVPRWLTAATISLGIIFSLWLCLVIPSTAPRRQQKVKTLFIKGEKPSATIVKAAEAAAKAKAKEAEAAGKFWVRIAAACQLTSAVSRLQPRRVHGGRDQRGPAAHLRGPRPRLARPQLQERHGLPGRPRPGLARALLPQHRGHGDWSVDITYVDGLIFLCDCILNKIIFFQPPR